MRWWCSSAPATTRVSIPGVLTEKVCSTERWFVDRPDLIGADGVHPTDAGHQYMADMIGPRIRTQLST